MTVFEIPVKEGNKGLGMCCGGFGVGKERKAMQRREGEV